MMNPVVYDTTPMIRIMDEDVMSSQGLPQRSVQRDVRKYKSQNKRSEQTLKDAIAAVEMGISLKKQSRIFQFRGQPCVIT